MGPSMNLFSRRKNSHPSDDRAAVQKSQDPSVVGRDINIYTGAPVRTMMRLHKNDGSDDLSSSSSPPPSATAGGIIHAPNMARIHTAFSPVDDSEKPPPSSAGISRLNSDTNAVARPGSNDYLHYTQQPVPKIHQPSPVRAVRPLQQHCPQLSYTSDSVSIPGVSMPPTPITSAITPTKKPFRFPATAAGDRLPISPPVSPESPMVYSYGPMDAGGSITPGASPMYHHHSRQTASIDRNYPGQQLGVQALSHSRSFSQQQLQPLPPTPNEESLLQRIRELEHKNRDLESETQQHGSRITALRQNHSAFVDSLKASHSAELDASRGLAHWVAVVEGKEREINGLRGKGEGLQAMICELEALLKARDDEIVWIKKKMQADKASSMEEDERRIVAMDLPDIGRRLIEETRQRKGIERTLEEMKTAPRDFEVLLSEEKHHRSQLQHNLKEDLDYHLQEEEKRREELKWIYGDQLEKLESIRNNERQEYDSHLRALRQEKEEAEHKLKETTDELETRKLSVVTHRSGNEELVAMLQKINARLAEEKRKNKHLESSMSKITEEAWFNVSDSKHDIQKLKNALEDKETLVTNLEFELSVTKRERSEFEEAWRGLQSECTLLEQALADRDERIKDLEFESGELLDGLRRSESELSRQQQSRQQPRQHHSRQHRSRQGNRSKEQNSEQSDAQVETSGDSSREGVLSSGDDTTKDDLLDIISKLRRDIKLYRSDIRAYKHDVRDRDRTIQQLSSQLSSPNPNLILQDDSTGSALVENERLKAQLDEVRVVAKQKMVVLADMEERMKKLRDEKETFEANALKQFQRMQQSYSRLEKQRVAGSTADIRACEHPTSLRLENVPNGRRRNAVAAANSVRPSSPPPPPPPSKSPILAGGEQGETFVW